MATVLSWSNVSSEQHLCVGASNLCWVHTSAQDTLNERSTAAVSALLDGRWEGSRQGRDAKHVVMLTGDNPASAERIARLVGIQDVRAVRSHAPWCCREPCTAQQHLACGRSAECSPPLS